MNIHIIGLGLIGGSLALDTKKRGFASRILGTDKQAEHCQMALELGLVDEIVSLEEGVKRADLVVLAIPVNVICRLLPKVLDELEGDTVVTDMGSTKYTIVQAVHAHPKRANYVASHPMAGTEYSGPKAAIYNLFDEKVAIICDRKNSHPKAVECVERLYESLNMNLIEMEAKEHDMHAAYVSHISHISSFVLATTVLEKEKSVANIFHLASGGFTSTVRLAKSSPQMWSPIFEQNAEHVVEVIDTYIEQLKRWKQHIETGNFDEITRIMADANHIRKILDTPPKKRLKQNNK